MKIVPYRAEHMKQLTEQEATASLSAYLRPEHYEALERSEYAFTGIANDRVIGCAGVVTHWPGRGEAWAALYQACGRHMPAIHMAARRFFTVCPLRRVEAIVGTSFTAGHRRARMLGFEVEAPLLRAYLPTGEDAVMYARVSHAPS